MMDKNKEQKNRSYSSLILISGLLIILVSYLAFVGNQKKLVTENEELTDTVSVLHEAIDSVAFLAAENSAALAVVSDYYRYRNFHQLDSVMGLLAEKFDTFYTMRPAEKSAIQEDFRHYWKRNPDSRYFMDANSMSVARLESGGHEVLVNSYYTRDGKQIESIMSIIRVDAGRQISYARDVVAD